MARNLKNLLVNKPWGNEYVICKTKNSLTTLLNINHNHKTSLHCHPTKKTGFIVLNGKVEVQLGFYDKVILEGPSKLMIRPGLFHSTKAISKSGAFVLELESPSDKDDLVRFRDDYGRQNKPYENRSKMSKINSDKLIFEVPKKIGVNKYNFLDIKITVEKQKDVRKLINRSKKTIFAIMEGGLLDKKNRLALSPGDIVKWDTIKKLTDVFNIKKHITFLTINK